MAQNMAQNKSQRKNSQKKPQAKGDTRLAPPPAKVKAVKVKGPRPSSYAPKVKSGSGIKAMSPEMAREALIARLRDDKPRWQLMLSGELGDYYVGWEGQRAQAETLTVKEVPSNKGGTFVAVESSRGIHIPLNWIFYKVDRFINYMLGTGADEQRRILGLIRQAMPEMIQVVKEDHWVSQQVINGNIRPLAPSVIAIKNGRIVGKKEQAKMADRFVRQEEAAAEVSRSLIAEATRAADRTTVLANLQNKSISLLSAVSGRYGYVVIDDVPGASLVIYFGDDSREKAVAVKYAQVMYIDEGHHLCASGVQADSKVYLSQVLTGVMDLTPHLRGELRVMHSIDAFAGYLRRVLARHGVHLRGYSEAS